MGREVHIEPTIRTLVRSQTPRCRSSYEYNTKPLAKTAAAPSDTRPP